MFLIQTKTFLKKSILPNFDQNLKIKSGIRISSRMRLTTLFYYITFFCMVLMRARLNR